jgi:hypothetical protein
MTDCRVETTPERLFTRRGFLQATGLAVGAATVGAQVRVEAQPKRGGAIRVVFSDGNSGTVCSRPRCPIRGPRSCF